MKVGTLLERPETTARRLFALIIGENSEAFILYWFDKTGYIRTNWWPKREAHQWLKILS